MPNLIVAAGISVPGSGGAGWKRSAPSALAAVLKASIAARASEPSVEDFRSVHGRMGLKLLLRLCAMQRGRGAHACEQAACQTVHLRKWLIPGRAGLTLRGFFAFCMQNSQFCAFRGGKRSGSENTRRR